ncbi:MAG: RIP metalloprotease RseP, partial [Proteobacteria bacterium]|nr:RIP metalloprotease RseP [Pseudomonadota bacterium]
ILSAIIVIVILVLVHEFGHYVVAKYFNVKVLKFSVGFGPKLFGIQGKETEYLISAVPLGGYVKLYGEDDKDEVLEDKERAFSSQSPLRRIAIVFAGPFFNFIFAFLVFLLINIIGYKTVSTKIGDVKENYPAYNAGIKKDDRILKIDGVSVRTWEEISKEIKSKEGKELNIEIQRDKDIITFKVSPVLENTKNIFGEDTKVPVLGIVSSDELIKVSHPVHKAFVRAFSQVYELTKMTLITIIKLIKRVIPVSSLGGPIMITKLAGETAKTGAVSLILFMALLSVNLAVLNLLPIPILDGGHIILFTYELFTGRKVSDRFKEAYAYVGIFIIILLTITVFYNDILRVFFGK